LYINLDELNLLAENNWRNYQILSFLILILTSWFSEGYFHGDEHFQILEFARYILGENRADELCWEYGAQIRPSLQPYIAASFIKICQFINIDSPFLHAFCMRLITAILSFWVMRLSFEYFSKFVGKQFLVFSQFFLWFLIFLNVRFSSETWSAMAFMFAFLFWFKWQDKTTLKLIVIGILLGLSFQFRFQSAFLVLGFGIWLLIQKTEIKQLTGLALGFILINVICIYLDSRFYGNLCFAPYNYFRVNLLEGKAASFGTNPWYYYLISVLEKSYLLPGLFALLGLIFSFIKFKTHPIHFVIIPFFIVHCLIGHKESRFLFPLAFFAPFYVAYFLQTLALYKLIYRILFSAYLITNLFLIPNVIFYSFHPNVRTLHYISNHQINTNDKLYYIEKNPYDDAVCYFNFYEMKNNPQLIRIKDPKEITKNKKGDNYLYISTKDNDRHYEIPRNSVLIFQSFPFVLTEYFNLNQWVNRTTISKFYKIENNSLD
jgi:phosphatidylinositol glycan class B